MRRTNIYLDEAQAAALDTIAGAERISRAELVRRLIDRAMSAMPSDLEGDLAAINESFGAWPDRAESVRGPDERAAHLDRIRQG